MVACSPWSGVAHAQEPGPESALIPSLPAALADQVWPGSAALAGQPERVWSSGHPDLDRELPGGGWPCGVLTEILTTTPARLEWRLLAPALRPVAVRREPLLLIGPPQTPHRSGLAQYGLADARIIWVQADSLLDRLWCLEQWLRAAAEGAVLAWVAGARPAQIRRLQVCARHAPGPVFLFRPGSSRHEPSAAPLRVWAESVAGGGLDVQLLKRRGPWHHRPVRLSSWPGRLAGVLAPAEAMA